MRTEIGLNECEHFLQIGSIQVRTVSKTQFRFDRNRLAQVSSEYFVLVLQGLDDLPK